jgi:thiamine pyridinylase
MRRLPRALAVFLLVSANLAVEVECSANSAPQSDASASAGSQSTVGPLVVGLYPYVPRIGQFQDALKAAWAGRHPDIPLQFLSPDQWDGGYDMNPPPNADVFVFDAMFMDYLINAQALEPLAAAEIDNLNDFIPYAIAGVQYGSSYYAIPQLGCTNILFYLKSDGQLAAARTLSDVKAALGQCAYTSQIPPDRRGMMLDLAGGTTNAAMYLAAAHAISGQTPPLPWNSSQIDAKALANVQYLLASASYSNATVDPNVAYQRGAWFGTGWGRALVDYTESMSAMSAQTRSQLAFKVMPLSDNTTSAPYFFSDVIAVNPTTRQRGTRALAVELANIMAATTTMVASLQGTQQNPVPQYLMPARPTIFGKLGSGDPIYRQMGDLVAGAEPVMFKVSPQSRDWLAQMKNTIRSAVRSTYPCGCDFVTSQLIWDNSQAPAVCATTCNGHGGWTGRWTNTYPAAQGMSVCGCTACAIGQPPASP